MKLSAPIYRLKRQAKILSRQEGIPLHQALDRVAVTEGYSGWSLLAAKYAATAPAGRLFPQLRPGDLVLLGARPGQGKTLMGLELAVEAMTVGHRSVFFTLEYTEKECRERLQSIVDPANYGDQFEVDCSDHICADYIIKTLSSASRGTLAVIDYLQLLDQRRDTPELADQIRALRSFARERGVILVFISQIARSYDPSVSPCPDIEDVRLPNPLDLSLFDKRCFLNDGEVKFSVAG